MYLLNINWNYLINWFCQFSITVVMFRVSNCKLNRTGTFTILQTIAMCKKCTQNVFVYGELGRLPFSCIDITALFNFGLRYCIGIKQNILELYIILCITI